MKQLGRVFGYGNLINEKFRARHFGNVTVFPAQIRGYKRLGGDGPVYDITQSDDSTVEGIVFVAPLTAIENFGAYVGQQEFERIDVDIDGERPEKTLHAFAYAKRAATSLRECEAA